MIGSDALKKSCEKGDYCATNSTSRAHCPLGMVCPRPDIKVSCRQGYYCNNGTYDEELVPCTEGYYCPTPSEKKPCPLEIDNNKRTYCASLSTEIGIFFMNIFFYHLCVY